MAEQLSDDANAAAIIADAAANPGVGLIAQGPNFVPAAGAPAASKGTVILGDAGGVGTAAYLDDMQNMLQGKEYTVQRISLNGFTQLNQLTISPPADLVGIVFAGHASTVNIGDATAADIAALLAKINGGPKFVILSGCNTNHFLNEINSELLDSKHNQIPDAPMTIVKEGYGMHSLSDVGHLKNFIDGKTTQDLVHYSIVLNTIGWYWYGAPVSDVSLITVKQSPPIKVPANKGKR